MTSADGIAVESLGTVCATIALAVWALREPRPVGRVAVSEAKPSLRFRFRQAGKDRTVSVRDGAVLGRAPTCDVVVLDASVSKRHARVMIDQSAWIEDLGSTNGTYVNGTKIDGTSVLRRGDRIALGAAKIVFLGLGARGSSAAKG